ncbi:glycerophosphodiester transporter [Pisolithus tinctorius]|nr:glycerophosphodiester transporter [Pisolithus tinctorius]
MLLSNGYVSGAIGAVITLFTREYPESPFGTQYLSKVLASTAFIGAAFSMSLGWLSYPGLMSAGIPVPIVFIFLSALSGLVASEARADVDEIVTGLCMLRFAIGLAVGLGHTYGSPAPMDHTGVSKSLQHRRLVLGTTTMADTGFVLAAFVPFVLCWIFGEQKLRMISGFLLGLGAVPPFVLLYECMVSTRHVDLFNQQRRDHCTSLKYADIPTWLSVKRYWKSVLGLSFAWFIYDFIMYPFGIYSSMIMNNITGGSSSLMIVFGWSVVISLFYVPGTVFGTFLIDCFDLKTVMIVGLLLQAIVGFTMGTMCSLLSNHIAIFAVIYGIFLGLGEVGPGSCLHILVAKTSPMAVHRQFYSIATAVGKVGAFIGSWVFPQIVDAFGGSQTAKGNTGPFWIGSGLTILSAVVTFFLVKPITDDGLKAEDKAFFQYLEENGFDVSHIWTWETLTEEVRYNEMVKQQLHDDELAVLPT